MPIAVEPAPRLLLTVREAAALLAVSDRTLWGLTAFGGGLDPQRARRP